MGTLASGSIDLNSLKVAGESNKYVTMIDGSGIRIHEAGAVNTNFAQINSNGMQIYKDGTEKDNKIAEFGAFTQIGKSNDIYLKIENSSLSLEDQGISNFQIFTEPLENGPTVNLQLYYLNQITGYNYYPNNTTHKYSPRNYTIHFGTAILNAGDQLSLSFKVIGRIFYDYNGNTTSTAINEVFTKTLTYGTPLDWQVIKFISMGSGNGSYAPTIIQASYDGSDCIVLTSKKNTLQSSNSYYYVVVKTYENTTISTNKQLSSLPIVTIGNPTLSYAQIDYRSLQLKDKEGNSYFYVSDLRDSNGSVELIVKYVGDGTTRSFNFLPPADNIDYTVTVSDDSGGTIDSKGDTGIIFSTAPNDNAIITITYTTSHVIAKAYTFGLRKTNSQLGALSVSEGYFTEASGPMSHSEGRTTEAKGFYSHAEGFNSTASGSASHAEGNGTAASKFASHAEGGSTQASGQCAHAEGVYTVASNAAAHAEGSRTTASNSHSHAEGYNTIASGYASHAGGYDTIAQGYAQVAIGKLNIAQGNTNNYSATDQAFIIGNGTSDNSRSNAFTVGWDGNVTMALSNSEALYTAINSLGWANAVLV